MVLRRLITAWPKVRFALEGKAIRPRMTATRRIASDILGFRLRVDLPISGSHEIASNEDFEFEKPSARKVPKSAIGL